MANPEQLEILKQGVEVWNKWQEENSYPVIDLRGVDFHEAILNGCRLNRAFLNGANLRGAKLIQASLNEANLTDANLAGANLNKAELTGAILWRADLRGAFLYEAYLAEANLFRANLTKANLTKTVLIKAKLPESGLVKAELIEANLSGADLMGANLNEASLVGADLSEADFRGANLRGANLREANLRGANLSGADLRDSNLSKTNLSQANLVGANINNARISTSRVYGVNVWDLEGEFQEQKDLIITPAHQSAITVDNIKVSQFVYLILNNKELRDVINTLTSKTVLILGRFSLADRKSILDALKNKLREYDLLPMVFDFDRPTDRDFTETIKTLAGMCYFVIADVTNPKSSPLELQATVPDYQIPFVPIIQEGELPFAMMANLQTKYNWMLDTISYDSVETLMDILKEEIIDRAMKKHDELRMTKASIPTIISGRELKDKGKKGKP